MATSSLGYIDDIIRDQIAAAGNDASKLQKIATSFGLSADDLASFKGVSTGDIQQLFRDAGIPLGTLLTGDVQRTLGTDTGIRQVEKGDDIVTEQVVGVQGDKLIVQQYDAYGNPTSRRLTKPNPSELQGWLQALGIVGMAMGAGDILSSLGGSAGAGAGAGAADLAFLEANAGALAPGAEVAAAGSNAGLASLNSNLASNLTVGEALSTISNPYSVITKPVTQTVYDYLVNTALKDVALSAGEKAVIKTAVGSIVNYSAAELTTGKGEQAFIGTWIGTAMNALPIPGSAEAFGLKQDATFNQLISNLSTKVLDVTGVSDYLSSLNFTDKATGQILREFGELGINTDVENVPNRVILERATRLSDQLVSTVSQSLANGISSGVRVIAAGGDAQQVGTAVILSSAGTLLGNTKIPGTSLTGNELVDNVELDVDSFADDPSITGGSGNDASVLVNAASGALDSILGGAGNDFSVIDYLGSDTKDKDGAGNDSISAGSGNDSVVVSATGNDSIDPTLNAIYDIIGANDSIFSGLNKDSISAGSGNDSVVVSATGNDSVSAGSGNDVISLGETGTIKPAPYDPNVDANAEDVNKAYLEIFGRAGDPEGVKFWDETGLGLNDIINMFRGSDEYKARNPSTTVTAASGNDSISAGSGNDSVVVSATGNDSIDLGSDNDVISLGGTDTINPAVYDSNVDANREDINKAYVEVLGRAGDESGLDFWDATGLGLDDIIDLFRRSDEYRAKTPSTTVTAASGNNSISAGSGNDSVVVSASGNDTIDLDTVGDSSIPLGGSSGNDSVSVSGAPVTVQSSFDSVQPCENPNQIRDPITGGCYDPIDYIVLGDTSGTSVTGGSGNDSIEVKSTSIPCDDSTQIRDPITGNCYDPLDYIALDETSVTGGSGNDTIGGELNCVAPKVANAAGTACVCPEGTTEQDGKCQPSVTVGACPAIGQIRDAEGNCVCPEGQVVIDDPLYGQMCGTPEDTVEESIKGGGSNDTIDGSICPIEGQIRDAEGNCVCPEGTTEQNGKCKPSVTVGACPAIGQIRDAEGNCVCPEGQVVIDDPLYGSMCGTPEDTVGESIEGGGRNDTIGGELNCVAPKVANAAGTACVCPEGTTEQPDGSCKSSVTVAACPAIGQIRNTAGDCVCPPGQVVIDDPLYGQICDTPEETIEGGGSNDTIGGGLNCVAPKVPNAAGTACVCPPGTTEQNGECKPSVTVGICPVVGQTRDTAGNCVCPPGQVPVNDTVSGGQICGTPEDTITGGGGNDTITGDKCPAGYFRNSKGECEVELAGLPSLFRNINLGGSGPASYTPNLTQPFTAARTYKAPPETYDYAGADTVGYEDPYFQRFGPITYTPPTGYLGAGVLPSPAGGTDTDTVDGAGVDTSGGGLAYGGLLSLARGGRTLPPRYLGGITDGMADRVPAHIDGKRPAALSDGEFVIPADVVSHLGNGNSSAGAKMLYEMMDRVRKARTGTKKQGREIDAERFMPR